MKKLLSIILISLLSNILLGQGNLELDVYNYMYYDSLDNYFSEKEYADIGVKGSYDKLNIKTEGFVTTFTFNLRKDNHRRTDTNLVEVYRYLVIDFYKDDEVEVWTIERIDGAILTFTHEFLLDTYMLSIPANKINRESYLYIFTKTI
jgi:hypothetical protein